MGTSRQLLVDQLYRAINKIKETEVDFLHPWWHNSHVNYTNRLTDTEETKPLHEVDFDLVAELDLVRLLEYLVRNQENRMSAGSMIYHENRRMLEQIMKGEAIDLSDTYKANLYNVPVGLFEVVKDCYVLREFQEGKDYCDGMFGNWIWSIGKHRGSGLIFASTDNRFYMNDDFECLFLR